MVPAKTSYPEFVPNQLLTADNLNDLFGYLDEQERLTRTNLIGIGIVCGLEIITATNGTSVTITKGCGITSEGYLAALPDLTFGAYAVYEPLTQLHYSSFVNTGITPRTAKFPLWELKQSAVDDFVPLTKEFLDNKAILLFIELKEVDDKTCDVNSCDDKGSHVHMSVLPLLVEKNNISQLNATVDCSLAGIFQGFTELKMPRWNVPAGNPATATHIIDAYRAILSTTFVNNIQNVLTAVYTDIRPLVVKEFSTNPFSGFASDFAFLNNNSISINQLIHIQYYYDFFSDLLQAYEEFCRKGSEVFCKDCCPDSSLFPRHLLLGEAFDTGSANVFRSNFVYSPLFDYKDLEDEVKYLFRKLVYLYRNLNVPAPLDLQNNIKITPSSLGAAAPSEKAIPYYYRANVAPARLYQNWNYTKSIQGKERKTLSYNVNAYNTTDDFVRNPLNYDLEPYNFLRIEGHIGQNYKPVLTNIQNLKKQNRLPFDVIALRTGDPDLNSVSDALKSCNIQDLETSYEIVRREWEAIIGKTMEFLDDNMQDARRLLEEASVGSDVVGDYRKLLSNGKNFIDDHPDLATFIPDYNTFIGLLEDLESQSTALRNELVQVINNGDISTEDQTLAEDLIDHFDAVALSCKKGTFRAIYQEFTNRTEEIFASIFFSNYAEKNPGLQHKGGVPMGGTFVIVYNKADTGNDPVVITGILRNLAGGAIFSGFVTIKGTNISINCDASGFFSITAPALPVVLQGVGFSFSTFFQQFSGEMLIDAETDFPVNFILNGQVVNLPPSEEGYNIGEEIIIADFYLPYSCCSGCSPVNMVIQEPNKAPTAVPVASATEITLPENQVTLDGSGSTDPEGPVKTYAWSVSAGSPACTIVSPTAAITNVTGMIEGIYGFILVVTDLEDKASMPVSITVTVKPAPNVGPVADAGTDQVVILDDDPEGSFFPGSTQLNGTASSDPDGTTLMFAWQQTSAPAGQDAMLTNAGTATPGAENLFPGEYVFELIVTDSNGATATDSVTITVQLQENTLPVADAGEDQVLTTTRDGELVIPASTTLDGAGSNDPDGNIVSFSWLQISGPDNAVVINDDTVSITDISNLFEGEYIFELTVTDDDGGSATDTVTITVNPPPENQAPVANAGEDINDFFTDNNIITLRGDNSFDPDGDTIDFEWQQTAGPVNVPIDNPAVSTIVLSGFSEPGTYEFLLTVTDNKGESATDTISVTLLLSDVIGMRKRQNCGDIEPLISEFENLQKDENFKTFKKSFRSYSDVEAWFKLMKEIVGKPLDEQISFFTNTTVKDAHIDALLVKWLTELFNIISGESSGLRLLSLKLYNILSALATYIMCIQDDDFDKSELQMKEVFNLSLAQLKTLKKTSLKTYTDEEKKQLSALKNIYETEAKKIEKNDEAAAKAGYLQTLNNLITVLTKLGL